MADDNLKGASATPATSPYIPLTSGQGGKDGGKYAPPQAKNNLREIVETIVFVIVLVLLLKSFVAEAFVIPTGSMAETLWGYQKVVTCPVCKFEFPVNCSSEVEDPPKTTTPVIGCTCPNCRYFINFKNEGMKLSCKTGDRVLVAKCLSDTRLPGMELKPYDVVVFKFPEEPEFNYTAMNYIKRLYGRPRETIGIFHGDVYVASEQDLKEAGLEYVDAPEEIGLDPRKRMHRDQAKLLLEAGRPAFKIMRKPHDKIVAMMRVVYDNDRQAKDLLEQLPPRWFPEANGPAWKMDNDKAPRSFERAAADQEDKVSWLRYRHFIRGQTGKSLITDYMGYNTGVDSVYSNSQPSENWVPDLILDCEVHVKDNQNNAQLWLELSKGPDRFQARIQLASGECTLVRRTLGSTKEEILAAKPTQMKKPGTYQVRFANVDERLVVWVDRELPFDDGIAYNPPKDRDGKTIRGPNETNDLEPASIGFQNGAVAVSKLVLWRDTYYTYQAPRGPQPPGNTMPSATMNADFWADPARWKDANLAELPALTFYVQPGHYLCLGDNSPMSADSRSWTPRRNLNDDTKGGLVPERLLLGRALLVYYPLGRLGAIK